jgi:hypothetical protein
MSFQRAERKKAKLRLALCGTSGSGKTYSALKIAKGLGGKVAMIDTEHGSGELYADLMDYDVVRLEAPYTPDKYITYIKEAEQAGYEVLIIDSLTHAWSGEGGVLDMADKAAKASKSGNSYMAWRDVTPKHNQLVDAILTSKMHVITTMRTKTEYVIETTEKGKSAPRKVGMAPIQRDGMEYEFTVVLDLSIDGHIASASKDRTRLFDGKADIPSEKTGKELLDWLNSGKSQEDAEKEKQDALDLKFNSSKNSILCAETLLELEVNYKLAYKDYKHDKSLITKIIAAKDKRKAELEQDALIKPEEISRPHPLFYKD